MNMNITSANATAVLTVSELFPAGITLQMFGADSALSQDSLDITDTRMGVDGYMVAGYLPNIHPITITLEAASPSFDSMATVWTAMQKNKTIYECSLVCTMPSIGRIFTWQRGVMKSGVPFPSMQRVLASTTWVFHFEQFNPAQN